MERQRCGTLWHDWLCVAVCVWILKKKRVIKLNHMDFVLNINKAAQNQCGILYRGLDVVDFIICETA